MKAVLQVVGLLGLTCVGRADLFDARGRLQQVELAYKASRQGSTVLAVLANDSIILCSSPLEGPPPADFLQTMITSYSTSRSAEDLYSIGVGIQSDLTFLYDKLFEHNLQARSLSGKDLPIQRLAAYTASLIHAQTFSSGVRPFGVGLVLFGSVKDGGFTGRDRLRLYEVDALGHCHDCVVTAIGKHSEAVIRQWGKIMNDQDPREMTEEQVIRHCQQCMKTAINEANDGGMVKENDLHIAIYSPRTMRPNERLKVLST